MTTKQDSFDVVIVGAGQAGLPLAFALAKAGKGVALIERKHLGGSCVNFGCTPTKAAIASARAAHQARNSEVLGIEVGKVSVNFAKVIGRAKEIAEGSRRHLEKAFQGSQNPLLIQGDARIVGRKGQGFELAVQDRSILAGRIVIDVGTQARIPEIPGLDRARVIHSENWLEKTSLPERLTVIGGGAIGLEMAQFYRRMGSRVTIIEAGPHLAPTEDEDVAAQLTRILEGEGIEVRTGAKIVSAEKDRIHLERAGKKETIESSELFVAVGRVPSTRGLGLESIPIEADDHGFIKVDSKLRTNVPGVFAAGDVRGGPMFTHTAWDDHRVLLPQLATPATAQAVADTARHEKERSTDRITPYAIFTDPELGRVGLTEKQAKSADHQVRVARYEMANASKAIELGETAGLIKVIVDRRTDLILGAAVLSAQGGELVHIFVEAMNARAQIGSIRNAVFIHPTLAEAVQSAVERLYDAD